MSSRSRIAVIVAVCLATGACGGGGASSQGDAATTTAPRPPLITRSTNEIGSTSTVPDLSVPPTSDAVELTVPMETVPIVTVPMVTVSLRADECPNGTWRIDLGGIGPFDAFGSADDVTVTSEGSFIAVFADGRYAITAEAFSLDLLTPTSDIGMAVAGSTFGELVVGPEMLTFIETSFEMTADVTIDGDEVPGEFIAEAFHQTFGSATVPYTCHADGTMTVTYESPTGPVTALHEPA